MSKKQTEEALEKTVTFSKKQFLKAANFTRIERDVLRSILKDDEQYTLEQAKKMLKEYTQRTVK